MSETLKSKEFTKEDEKNYIVEKFMFLAREQEQTEKEMIELCCRIVTEHGTSMEAAIDEHKQYKALEQFTKNSQGFDFTEQGITD